MFAAVRAQEKELPAACDESDARSDMTDEEIQTAAGPGEGNTDKNEGAAAPKDFAEEEDDDELSNDQ